MDELGELRALRVLLRLESMMLIVDSIRLKENWRKKITATDKGTWVPEELLTQLTNERILLLFWVNLPEGM